MSIDEYLKYQEVYRQNPPIEERFDLYMSLLINIVSQLGGSKDSNKIPIINWAEKILSPEEEYALIEKKLAAFNKDISKK